jgi:hypothetical protein
MSITTDNHKTNHAQPNVKGVEGFLQFFGRDKSELAVSCLPSDSTPISRRRRPCRGEVTHS